MFISSPVEEFRLTEVPVRTGEIWNSFFPYGPQTTLWIFLIGIYFVAYEVERGIPCLFMYDSRDSNKHCVSLRHWGIGTVKSIPYNQEFGVPWSLRQVFYPDVNRLFVLSPDPIQVVTGAYRLGKRYIPQQSIYVLIPCEQPNNTQTLFIKS